MVKKMDFRFAEIHLLLFAQFSANITEYENIQYKKYKKTSGLRNGNNRRNNNGSFGRL